MYRRIALTIALAVSVLSLALVSSDSTARAQKPSRFTADTGVVMLGPNQMLRLIAVNRGKADTNVRFTRMEYSQGACGGGGCKITLNGEVVFLIGQLAPGEAVSLDIPNTSFGVRGTAFTATDDLWFTTMIIDTTTGNVVVVNNLGSALGAPGN